MPEMTYDPTPADQPEFSADELDSLQVGEQLAQAEEQKLAGKYESAEELERAYIELQQKFGERGQEEEQVEGQASRNVGEDLHPRLSHHKLFLVNSSAPIKVHLLKDLEQLEDA